MDNAACWKNLYLVNPVAFPKTYQMHWVVIYPMDSAIHTCWTTYKWPRVLALAETASSSGPFLFIQEIPEIAVLGACPGGGGKGGTS